MTPRQIRRRMAALIEQLELVERKKQALERERICIQSECEHQNIVDTKGGGMYCSDCEKSA